MFGGCSPTLPRCCYKKRIGNAYLCCQTHGKNPRIICMCGAGWGSMIVTYCLVFGISGSVFAATFWLVPIWVSVTCSCVWVLTWLVLGRTSFGDPGIFPYYEKPKSPSWRYCTQTGSFRPPQQNIKYCHDTGVLLSKIDHFCPWTGTTIAGGNLCYFHAFLGMLVVTFVSTMACGYMAATVLDDNLPGLFNRTWR